MERRTISSLSLPLMLLLFSCGYAMSGKWEDDPKNWKRAFRTRKPEHVVVVHSIYWRAPHWTFEAGYQFQIRANRSFEGELFGRNKLRRLSSTEAANAKVDCFSECAPWFAPKPLEQYEVWGFADQLSQKFRVLIDKTSRDVFVADHQV